MEHKLREKWKRETLRFHIKKEKHSGHQYLGVKKQLTESSDLTDGMENTAVTMEISLATFLVKLNIYLLYDSATPLLGIYPRKN